MHGTCGLINPWHYLWKMSICVGNPGRPPYVIPRGSAGLKKKVVLDLCANYARTLKNGFLSQSSRTTLVVIHELYTNLSSRITVFLNSRIRSKFKILELCELLLTKKHNPCSRVMHGL